MIKVIIITSKNQRIITRFSVKKNSKKDPEILKERAMKKAKKFRSLVKQLEHPMIELVALIDDSITKMPDKGTERMPGHMWCPYCGKQRVFRSNYKGEDYEYCRVCGVSNADFHVKSINRTWWTQVATDQFGVLTREEKREAKALKRKKRKERKANAS